MSSAVFSGARAPNYKRVRVERVVSTRYTDNMRPDSWDRRVSGIDVVTVDGGETTKLQSTPMQSPPQVGWILMLTGGSAADGFHWTLYGMPRVQ